MKEQQDAEQEIIEENADWDQTNNIIASFKVPFKTLHVHKDPEATETIGENFEMNLCVDEIFNTVLKARQQVKETKEWRDVSLDWTS